MNTKVKELTQDLILCELCNEKKDIFSFYEYHPGHPFCIDCVVQQDEHIQEEMLIFKDLADCIRI